MMSQRRVMISVETLKRFLRNGEIKVKGRVLILFAGALVWTLASALGAQAQAVANMRWDLVAVDFTTGTVSAGGTNTPAAKDGSTIALTGSGFFRANESARIKAVAEAGGGTWETFDSTGTPTGQSGTYTVLKGPAYFQVTAGALPADLTDTIGNAADARAGMLSVEIEFSDGDRGVLEVLCALPGAPPTNFEGSMVTKGTAEYRRLGAPPKFTLFHVVP